MDHTKFCTEIEVVTDVIRRSVASNEHNRLTLKKANLVNGFYNKNDVKCDHLVTDVCNFHNFVTVLFFDSLFLSKVKYHCNDNTKFTFLYKLSSATTSTWNTEIILLLSFWSHVFWSRSGNVEYRKISRLRPGLIMV